MATKKGIELLPFCDSCKEILNSELEAKKHREKGHSVEEIVVTKSFKDAMSKPQCFAERNGKSSFSPEQLAELRELIDACVSEALSEHTGDYEHKENGVDAELIEAEGEA